jgi:hypothetical protein
MTALGKILIFFNLIFSVVVGALVIMDYTARTHWAEGVKKRDERIQVLNASNQAHEVAQANAEAEAEKRAAALKNQVKYAEDARARVEEQLRTVQEALKKEKDRANGHEAVNKSLLEEAKLRQSESLQLRDQVKKLDAENTQLVQKANTAVAGPGAAAIERAAFKQRNTQMLAQLREMAKEIQALRASGASPTRVASRGKNPPTETVEGLVKSVSADGLMTLTIGSDSGLSKGHTLELFRLNPAKYLGTVRVIETTPKEAVAQPVGRLGGEVQAGDHVASRILGN